ncbi:hypothetical protein [Niallia oryzisoli]|uniref:hypothetical protein n=1 Tax=Niallia oryzisoli TaxID=1737571 RepID=UPI003735C552
MPKNQQNSEQMPSLPEHNPIRERLKNKHGVDFSGATRRRLALMYQGREYR